MEIWVPYGDVEALLTLQAENLGELIDPKPEDRTEALVERLAERFRESERVILSDARPQTIKVLQGLVKKLGLSGNFRLITPFAKEVEQAVPEVKGMVARFQNPSTKIVEGENEVRSPPELADGTRKLVLGTAVSDPLVGLVDSIVGLALLTMPGASKLAYLSRETDEPSVLTPNKSYDALCDLATKVSNCHFATVFSKGGQPSGLVEGAAIKEAAAQFQTISAPQAKAIIVAPGGRGYDGSLSQAIRSLWNAVNVLKKSGEILLVSECRDGVGSEALQMLVTGRIAGDSPRRLSYVYGMEEIAYINRLREDYSITLLSALPELYTTTKLRFRTATSGAEAVTKVLNSVGRNTKFHVVPRLGETILARAQ